MEIDFGQKSSKPLPSNDSFITSIFAILQLDFGFPVKVLNSLVTYENKNSKSEQSKRHFQQLLEL
jgi:hypothetical protein